MSESTNPAIAFPPQAEIGQTYSGKVKTIMPYGAFVEIFPGTDGLLHVNATSVSIADAPQYAHRGFMADTGRRFWPVPTVEALLDAMSWCKLNVLHLHLSDNCRYAVQSDK